MPHHCIVPQCSNTSANSPELSFYRLPLHDENLLKKWLVNIRRENPPVNEHSRVCSTHFENGKKDGKNNVPTIFAWTKKKVSRPPPRQRGDPVATTSKFCSIGVSVHIHAENHVNTCTKDLIISTTDDKEVLVKPPILHVACNTEMTIYCDKSTNTPVVSQTCEASTQTDELTVSYSDASTMTEQENEQEGVPFRFEQIRHDDGAVRFYTGFPSLSVLMICFTFLGDAVANLSYRDHTKLTKGKPHKLSPLNEFFLMLCRLRVGLCEQDLAYRFGISQTSVSRIVTTWVNFCYCKFKELQIWPSRTIVDANMPLIFKELYPSTRCIIDATEIFIQKPQNPTAQQLTFSNYKNHNTFKALIAISPSGAISYVSDLFGGNISDKELTTQCGLLDYLEVGDSVMADRGFNISELLDTKGVTLNIPPKLTDPSGQLSGADRVKTRRIASVRVHVERAIGRIKNFNILESVPNSMHNVANQIFYVCALMTNFHPTLID